MGNAKTLATSWRIGVRESEVSPELDTCLLILVRMPLDSSSVIRSREKFFPFLINILQETQYVEVVSVEKHRSDWIGLEEKETLKPFLDWLMNCITYENCLTSDEVALYRDLKCNNKLVPIEELDQQLLEYFNEESSRSLDADLQSSIVEAEKELQNLKSLEDYLKKKEKSEKVVDGLEPFIKSELKELEVLNSDFNETLNKYKYAWDDLKCHFSEEYSVDLGSNNNSIMKCFNNQINQNVNEHFQNDFKEMKPTAGKINVTPLDYWLINKKLSEVESCIIDTTATMYGNSMIINHLNSLKNIISVNPLETSLSYIQKFLDEIANPNEKLSGVLSTTLQDEVNCLVKLHLNDTKKCTAFLEDRFNKLTMIENILQTKMILNEALKFIVKRDRVIHDFQCNTLIKFSKNIEVLATQHENRMEVMKNHTNVNNIQSLDPNYKAMMKYLGVQNSDYKTLSSVMLNFRESICLSYADIEKDMLVFQKSFAERFNEIKKNDHLVINGPTREIFGNGAFRNCITDLRNNLKTQKKISETFTKVEEIFKTVKSGCGKKDFIWQKILENPKEFIRRLYEIEEETEQLKERVRIEVMNK